MALAKIPAKLTSSWIEFGESGGGKVTECMYKNTNLAS